MFVRHFDSASEPLYGRSSASYAQRSTGVREWVARWSVLKRIKRDVATDAASVTSSADPGLVGVESEVFQRLRAAIVEQVLPPGTKLAEEELAGIYGISRMRVRRILLALSHFRIVTLFAGRGAFVAKPSPAEAVAIFQARRLIETAVLAEMVAPAGPALLATLRQNVSAGRAANDRGDRAEAIRLSGAFHVDLITALGNPVVAGIVEELVARSSLVLTLYHRGDTPVCRDGHHANLVVTLGSAKFRQAAPAMQHHLAEMEATLDTTERSDKPIKLRSLLQPLDHADPAELGGPLLNGRSLCE